MNFLFLYKIITNKPVFWKSSLSPTHSSLMLFSKNKCLSFLLAANKNKMGLIDLFYYQYPNKKILHNYVLYDYTTASYFFIYVGDTRNVSGEKIYNSLNWLERELVEFTGYFLENLSDSRNLLLDYNKTYNPLLKVFPCVGFEEVYYDNFFDKVMYTPTNFIEL